MIFHVMQALRANKAIYRRGRRIRNWLRRAQYSLKNVHNTTYLGARCRISRDLVVHEYCFIGRECIIGPKVEIGAYSMLASRVAIVGADHRFDIPGLPMTFSGRPKLDKTTIERDVWIGHGVILMAGVRIARGAIVAAGAVVTADIPPYEIWGGVPARKLRDRFGCDCDRRSHDAMLRLEPYEGDYAEYRF